MLRRLLGWIEHTQTYSVHVLHQDGGISNRQVSSFLVRWLVSVASLAESEVTKEMDLRASPVQAYFDAVK